MNPPKVVAVVPTHNRRETVLRFWAQWQRVTTANASAIFVDAGSKDGTARALRERGAEVIEVDADHYWTASTNAGVRAALELGCDYVLTINEDATFEPDLLDRLLTHAVGHPRRIVGARVMRSDVPGRVRCIGTSCVFRGTQMYQMNREGERWKLLADQIKNPMPVNTLCGNGVLLPRGVFDTFGLYDERSMPHYHADSDLVLRAKGGGFEVVVAMDAVVWDAVDGPRDFGPLWNAIGGRRSDRYWRAVWATHRRHAQGGMLRHAWGTGLQWLPYLLPRGVRERLRKRRWARREGGMLPAEAAATRA